MAGLAIVRLGTILKNGRVPVCHDLYQGFCPAANPACTPAGLRLK